MRNGTRLTIMMTGLVVLGLLVSACSSGGGGMAPVPGGTPDAGADLGGGGATGLGGSSSSSNGGQTSPGSQPDAAVLPDAARPLDLAVSSDLASAKPDLPSQSDSAFKPDGIPQPDFASPPDVPIQGDAGTDGPHKDGEASPDGDIVLFGLNAGTSCYKVTSALPGGNDGCDLGVAKLQGLGMPGNYDPSTGTFALGTNGSLGVGPIRYNQGTLVRNKTVNTDPTLSGCMWNQADTTALTMTDTNKFTVSVVEQEDSIAAACGLSFSACTSTWTWTMEVDASKRAPDCSN